MLGARCGNSDVEQLLSVLNRVVSPQESLHGTNSTNSDEATLPRLPRNVQAVYLKPLRRRAEYGVPSCDLQLRSYSVRNVEFFADFALRAAYYLNLPASGPVPLPRITERWTVPRSNFVHKKSQENFERITVRRLIQIKDGNPETVEMWLAFLQKHQYHGVGMKANMWNYESLSNETTDPLEDSSNPLGVDGKGFGENMNEETSRKVAQLLGNDASKSGTETRA